MAGGMTVLILSLSLALLAAPLWRRILSGPSWLDSPRAERHHARVVSRAGGVAWMAAVLAGLAAACLTGANPAGQMLIIVVLSASFLLGRLDDLGRIGPGAKWCLQTGVLALVIAGMHIGGVVDLIRPAPLSTGIAAVVALMLQTALGIFDNMDGALALTASGALFLAAAGAAPGPLQPAAAAGLGATLGFLAWNRPPARLFLGNAGSQPLGLLIPAIVFAALCGPSWTIGAGGRAWVLLLPLAWPLLDLVVVSVGRTFRGSAPWCGGRDHTTHRLARRMGSDKAVFAALLIVTSLATAAGYLILRGAR